MTCPGLAVAVVHTDGELMQPESYDFSCQLTVEQVFVLRNLLLICFHRWRTCPSFRAHVCGLCARLNSHCEAANYRFDVRYLSQAPSDGSLWRIFFRNLALTGNKIYRRAVGICSVSSSIALCFWWQNLTCSSVTNNCV